MSYGLTTIYKGNANSGNHGHEGRPGQVGGSSTDSSNISQSSKKILSKLVKNSNINTFFEDKELENTAIDSIASEYQSLVDRFPVLAKVKLYSLTLTDDKLIKLDDKYISPIALKEADRDYISQMCDLFCMNKEHEKNFISISGKQTKNNWDKSDVEIGKSTSSAYSIDGFRHELGHAFYFTDNKRSTNKVTKFFDLLVDNNFTKSIIKEKVSVYAGTNDAEAFAECFCIYTAKNYKKGMLPKEIENYFSDVLKKKKSYGLSIIKGGPGSGNYNHIGRPGQVGGSGDDNAGVADLRYDELTSAHMSEHNITVKDLEDMTTHIGETATVKLRNYGGVLDVQCLWNWDKDDAKLIGHLHATINTEKKSLEIGTFILGNDLMNKQGATKTLTNLEKLAKEKFGVTSVSLYADVSIGPYAWAKMSFDFSSENKKIGAIRGLKDYASHTIDNMYPEGEKRNSMHYMLNKRIKNVKTAKDIANFDIPGLVMKGENFYTHNGDVPEDMTMHVGKAFMLDEGGLGGWDAKKEI